MPVTHVIAVIVVIAWKPVVRLPWKGVLVQMMYVYVIPRK